MGEIPQAPVQVQMNFEAARRLKRHFLLQWELSILGMNALPHTRFRPCAIPHFPRSLCPLSRPHISISLAGKSAVFEELIFIPLKEAARAFAHAAFGSKNGACGVKPFRISKNRQNNEKQTGPNGCLFTFETEQQGSSRGQRPASNSIHRRRKLLMQLAVCKANI